ncbi:NUDIX domain-containing protein [Primorskyibacter sp. S87]|uniref:NUDIX domain-containing protein n=1 Tax=Primorskyibacter sp. S87 TaxID=3415126 RepID=UPI003C7A6F82
MAIHAITQAKTHVGAKIALLCNGQLVTYLRDDFPYIHDPGLWDFPGGERNVDETALECAIRETGEEFGIKVDPADLVYASDYKSHQPGRADVAFFVAEITSELIESIRFGEEGQYWRLMTTDEFLGREDAVKELRRAMQDFLNAR